MDQVIRLTPRGSSRNGGHDILIGETHCGPTQGTQHFSDIPSG